MSANSSTSKKVVDIDNFRGRGTTYVSDWRATVTSKIERIGAGDTSDYDFEGSVNEVAAKHACEFTNQLSMLLKAPEVGLNSDGSILLEWVMKDNNGHLKLGSVIFDGKHIIYSITKNEKIETNGATLYTDVSVNMLKALLFQYFEKDINHSRSIAR